MGLLRYAAVDKDICVSCGSCASECPVNAIEIWRGCYAEVSADKCVGCGRCERICPAACISLHYRENDVSAEAGR